MGSALCIGVARKCQVVPVGGDAIVPFPRFRGWKLKVDTVKIFSPIAPYVELHDEFIFQ